MKKILITILILVLLLMSVIVGKRFYFDYMENKISDTQKSMAKTPVDDNLMDFTNLKKTNTDAVAWLKIPGTVIDHPVVQGTDNKFYVDHTIEKKYNRLGALFLDFRNKPDFSDFNNIIYGHNMKNGKMFGELVKFKEKAFFETYKTATLYTPQKTYELEIFAVAVTLSSSEYYNYFFDSQSGKEDFLQMIKNTAMYQRDIGITTDDILLTLGTCSYEYKNARTVVVARLK